jgi:hypothetical protein
VPEQREDERQLRGSDPGPVVAHHPPTARDVRLEEQVAQLGAIAELLAARPGHGPNRHVGGARDVAEPLRVPLEAAVFSRRAGIEERHVR